MARESSRRSNHIGNVASGEMGILRIFRLLMIPMHIDSRVRNQKREGLVAPLSSSPVPHWVKVRSGQAR
jgi:hypothetical protein